MRSLLGLNNNNNSGATTDRSFNVHGEDATDNSNQAINGSEQAKNVSWLITLFALWSISDLSVLSVVQKKNFFSNLQEIKFHKKSYQTVFSLMNSCEKSEKCACSKFTFFQMFSKKVQDMPWLKVEIFPSKMHCLKEVLIPFFW